MASAGQGVGGDQHGAKGLADYREPWLLARARRVHPLVGDAAFATFLALLGLIGLQAGPRPPDVTAVLLVLGQTLPLCLRQRHPVGVLAVVEAATLAALLGGEPLTGAAVGSLVAFYTVSASASPWVVGIAFAGFVVGLQAAVARGTIALQPLLAALVVLVGACVLGHNLRERRAHAARMEEQAARREREREHLTRQAVLDERERIARDMHDVVAHNLSLIMIQAEAAERILGEPERARTALRAIKETGRDTLTDMRRLVGLLRPGDAPAAPPGLGQLTALLARVEQQSGLAVDLRVRGERRPLPGVIEQAAYRIVQEALTNCLTHGGPSRAEVALCYQPGELEVQVTDDGPPAGRPADLKGGGHGLAGMRERVALLGGDLEVGGRPQGGYRVRARLPVARS